MVVENKSYDNLTHRRSVFFVDKRYFVLVDEAIGSAVGDVALHFQLAPGKAIFDPKSWRVTSDFSDGYNVMVETTAQKGLEMEEEEGQVSFLYTKKEPRPAFSYRIKKTADQGNVRLITLVVPYENQTPKINVTVVGNTEIGGSKLQLEIDENGKKQFIGYTL
jgi:heparan-sulfate lyase